MRLTVDVCGHNLVPRPPSKWSVEETTLHTEEVNFVVVNTLYTFHIIVRLKTSIILKDMTLISLLNCQLQCTLARPLAREYEIMVQFGIEGSRT